MLDTALRPRKDGIFEPLVRLVAPRISANWLTVLALVASVGAAGAAWRNLSLVSVAAWLLSRIFDGLDGAVARIRQETSDLGGYLDILGDTIGYAIIPVGVALGQDARATWIALGVFGAMLYINTISWSFLAAILEKRGRGAAAGSEITTITMPPALVEGAETIVLYSAFLLFPKLAAWIFALFSLLLVINVAQRALWARRSL